MALLQIAEPGQSTAPHQHRLAVGIDLGTTNSLVASVRSGDAQTLPDSEGEHIMPSVVHYGEEEILTGRAAEAKAVTDPLNTISSVKRLMGRGVADLNLLGNALPYHFVDRDKPVPRIQTRRGNYTATEVSAEILKTLSKRAEQTLGFGIQGAVITVPAYFDDAQRQATKDAASLAGIHVLRLLNEPTAAAVAYGLDREHDGVIAVYDLGGGTFDISILRLNKGVFEVMATGGDSALGGDDLDHAIAEWLMQQAGVEQDLKQEQVRHMLRVARGVKEALTDSDEVPVDLVIGEQGWNGVITREIFDSLAEPLIKKTLVACRRVVRDAGIQKEDINEVVMVGGSTRVPAVRDRVGAFFETDPLVSIDPDRVVAIGAAIQADLLAGNRPEDDMLLLDVIPLSLGIETMGGLTEKIIHRNTPIPVTRAQEFTTYKDGQTAMAIHVVQGERELVDDCRSLARFELRGFPPQVAGAARIHVAFQVDADGLLSVSAREETSNTEASINVKPSYGLTDTEIETMLRASMEHAEEDMQSRTLREQQVEADRVVEALDAALAKDGDQLLDEAEKKEILRARDNLVAARQEEDEVAIENAITILEAASENYVARRMNTSIRNAMTGHSVKDYLAEEPQDQ